ncbi:cryptochrome/photolyase family protein [Nitrincola sp. MINF-07-Sa-05]|uniref:cryptochrome/photolyase family protein n=1 Tax=Nitrincola salilacus TaxID=3400273 RepID=UPI0039181414
MKTRFLYLILGDQLSHDYLTWAGFDPEQDQVLMAEVLDESRSTLSSKQRTVLFLSAMRHFAQELRASGIRLTYIDLTQQCDSFSSALEMALNMDLNRAHTTPEVLRCVLPGDHRVLQQIRWWCQEHQVSLELLPDSHFITQQGEFTQWMAQRKQPRMEYWYRHQRKTRQWLMDAEGKPQGGQWNYDKENRGTFTKQGPVPLPPLPTFSADSITHAVMADVEKYLLGLPGAVDNFNWPVTREQALTALDDFITHRLPRFGDYQDAMWTDQPWLYHSLLSSSLNLKLLNPVEVIEAAEKAWLEGRAPLNAVEGFIRQILGWREYIRGLYWHHRDQWDSFNYLQSVRSLPDLYWTADTDMQCLKQSVSQVLQHGYGHHIQRLMVTGLFALLWETKPQLVHEWYLAMYVDAVAWVEVPNTLGMSQYADGGIVGSKPYIASGAYIKRMSNYCQHCPYKPEQASGEKACPFTTLYWHFIAKHRSWLQHNPRLGMQVKNWDRKDVQEQQAIDHRAQWLFENLVGG